MAFPIHVAAHPGHRSNERPKRFEPDGIGVHVSITLAEAFLPGYLARPLPCETIDTVRREFAATVWQEGDWYVSQCLEVDVASQGATAEEALRNLQEALELHFEPPHATRPPEVRTIEIDVGAT